MSFFIFWHFFILFNHSVHFVFSIMNHVITKITIFSKKTIRSKSNCNRSFLFLFRGIVRTLCRKKNEDDEGEFVDTINHPIYYR